jgi:hypothetical protein
MSTHRKICSLCHILGAAFPINSLACARLGEHRGSGEVRGDQLHVNVRLMGLTSQGAATEVGHIEWAYGSRRQTVTVCVAKGRHFPVVSIPTRPRLQPKVKLELEVELGVMSIERKDATQGAILRAWLEQHVCFSCGGRCSWFFFEYFSAVDACQSLGPATAPRWGSILRSKGAPTLGSA